VTTFNVYKHPVHGVEAVKVGFSWPAFFFSVFWMLSKQLWKYAAIFFVLNVLLNASESSAERTFDPDALPGFYIFSFAASIALWLIPAFEGNKWRETDLRRRGYVLTDTLQGSSPDAVAAQSIKVQ
jgi:hypothetical protein